MVVLPILKWYLPNSLGKYKYYNITLSALPPVFAGSEFNNNRLGFESQLSEPSSA